MVKALQDAIRRAEELPETEQEALAAILQAEMADEARWQRRFAETPSTIEALVRRAKKQFADGQFEEHLPA